MRVSGELSGYSQRGYMSSVGVYREVPRLESITTAAAMVNFCSVAWYLYLICYLMIFRYLLRHV